MDPSVRSRAWFRYVVGGVIGVVLVATALYVVFFRPQTTPTDPEASPSGCAGMLPDGIMTNTGECLGIVSGGQALDPVLREPAEGILRENADVAGSPRPYVKVALLTPLTLAKNAASAMSLDQIKFSLEGSLTALRRINHTNDFGDQDAVHIQLVLVNQGSRQEFSEALIKQILDQNMPNHPLVAVVGLGSSFTGTEATVAALASRDIPMVSAVASATTLTKEKYETLRSVSPSNLDYARALRQLLDDHQSDLKLRNGIIVQDTNDDPYTKTLREAFQSELGPYMKFPSRPFTGGTVGAPATPNVFNPAITDICTGVENKTTPLDMVFFAGRVEDFKVFAEKLEGRMCRDTPLAVLVGATGFEAVGTKQYTDLLNQEKVTVIYSSSADAPAWAKEANNPPEGFGRFLSAFQSQNFPDPNGSLVDGYAVMYHDALATAALAVRLAAEGRQIPRPADVDVQFGTLALSHVVRAASGALTFADCVDGRARDKVVVYRQIGSNTPYHLPNSLKPYLTHQSGCP